MSREEEALYMELALFLHSLLRGHGLSREEEAI